MAKVCVSVPSVVGGVVVWFLTFGPPKPCVLSSDWEG